MSDTTRGTDARNQYCCRRKKAADYILPSSDRPLVQVLDYIGPVSTAEMSVTVFFGTARRQWGLTIAEYPATVTNLVEPTMHARVQGVIT